MKNTYIFLLLAAIVLLGSTLLGYGAGYIVSLLSSYLVSELSVIQHKVTVYGFTAMGFIMGLFVAAQFLRK
jgi:hypothetical protein